MYLLLFQYHPTILVKAVTMTTLVCDCDIQSWNPSFMILKMPAFIDSYYSCMFMFMQNAFTLPIVYCSKDKV